MPPRQQQLAHLESQGEATQFAAQMHALIPKCPLLENFSQAEVELLATFMTEHLVNAGYDSLYFPESETQEGELVVFDRNNVKLETPARTVAGPAATSRASE